MANKINYPLLLWSLIASISVMLFVLSLSYYYINWSVDDKENKQAIINTGELATDFITTQYIDNQSVGLITPQEVAQKAEYTAFNVSHADSSTASANYNIFLTQITLSENLLSPYFKWSLLLNNQEIAQGSFADYDQSGRLQLNSQKLKLPVGQKDNWVLRVWLENDPLIDQNELLNGSFKAKVTIDVVAQD